jgi:dienelactone hydrolase
MKVWPGLLWWLRAVLCWAYGSLAHAQQAVELPSLDQRQGQALSLTAQWFRAPVRAGDSAPAMVLLHGCGGLWTRDRRRINPRFQEMAARLNTIGIHALALDSLTPRGETELCTQKVGTRAVTQKNRRLDALGALAWLAAQPDVDSRRLGMLGWSNGGSTVLAATDGERGLAATRRRVHQTALGSAMSLPGRVTVIPAQRATRRIVH